MFVASKQSVRGLVFRDQAGLEADNLFHFIIIRDDLFYLTEFIVVFLVQIFLFPDPVRNFVQLEFAHDVLQFLLSILKYNRFILRFLYSQVNSIDYFFDHQFDNIGYNKLGTGNLPESEYEKREQQNFFHKLYLCIPAISSARRMIPFSMPPKRLAYSFTFIFSVSSVVYVRYSSSDTSVL